MRSSLFSAIASSGSPAATALVLPDTSTITYAKLPSLTDEWCRAMKSANKSLVVCFGGRNLASVSCFLAALRLGHAIAVLDAGLQEQEQNRFLAAYSPEFVAWCPGNGMATAKSLPHYRHVADFSGAQLWTRTVGAAETPHPDLAVILSTSGSTGNPKAARLSYQGLVHNSASISGPLGVVAEAQRGVIGLPFHFIFGLLTLTSHLLSGASVAITADRPTSRSFWRYFVESQCTSFRGVASTYDVLWRMLPDLHRVPTLQTLTQGGSRLRDERVLGYASFMERRKGRFLVTYGQTEAGRMASLDAINSPERVGSVGKVVPGCQLSTRDNGTHLSDGRIGDIFYSGPNVMLGYANCRADLVKGDELGGVLDTGDIGYLDAGFLYLTGRRERITKIAGLRLSLDDIERVFEDVGPVVAVDAGDQGVILLTEESPRGFEKARPRVAARLGIPISLITIRHVNELPRTRTGKIDYTLLAGCW
jgi:acyl-coenzyme A synthetase/AMP-(fatty) acid ligase